MKVLPELLKSVEFGGGGPKVLGAIVKIGSKLSQDEYNSRVTPVIVRLFANPDRALRVSLLENLPSMTDFLPQKIVNDKIFPQMVSFLIFTVCQDQMLMFIFSRRLGLPTLHLLFESRLSRLFYRL